MTDISKLEPNDTTKIAMLECEIKRLRTALEQVIVDWDAPQMHNPSHPRHFVTKLTIKSVRDALMSSK